MFKSLFNKSSNSSTVTINGKTYQGRNITVVNNQVIVDGVPTIMEECKSITITINGDVERLETTGDITVNGHCLNAESTNGEINITGGVGSVITTNGNVTCGNVSGSVKTTNGDIKYRR